MYHTFLINSSAIFSYCEQCNNKCRNASISVVCFDLESWYMNKSGRAGSWGISIFVVWENLTLTNLYSGNSHNNEF